MDLWKRVSANNAPERPPVLVVAAATAAVFVPRNPRPTVHASDRGRLPAHAMPCSVVLIEKKNHISVLYSGMVFIFPALFEFDMSN